MRPILVAGTTGEDIYDRYPVIHTWSYKLAEVRPDDNSGLGNADLAVIHANAAPLARGNTWEPKFRPRTAVLIGASNLKLTSGGLTRLMN